MHALTIPPSVTPADRLGFTLFIAIVAHAIVVLGITFSPHERPREKTSTLDIVLVQQKSEEAPEDVDYLAQANQQGGGESDEAERPATPLRAPFTGPRPDFAAASPPTRPRQPEPTPTPGPVRPPAPAQEPAAQPPAPKPLLAQTAQPAEQRVTTAPTEEPAPEPLERAEPETPAPDEPAERPAPRAEQAPQPDPEPEPRRETPEQTAQTLSAAQLVQQSLAIASLNAEIDRRLQAYAERPRRKWITARTKEHKYAAYMEAWRQKVERIGNLNYPDEARRRRLSGSLLLDVALNPDGSVNEIVLRRSSGQKVLDDAAKRIVELAAPFSEFPPSIAEETDILHIERTWQFLSGNRFASR